MKTFQALMWVSASVVALGLLETQPKSPVFWQRFWSSHEGALITSGG